MPDRSDLLKLAELAAGSARDGESLEAYADEGRRTEVTAHRGEVEGLTFAESRGVGVRIVAEGRLGYAYAADPGEDELREVVGRARENAALGTEDEFNVLPDAAPIEPMPELFRREQAEMATGEKVRLALDLERRATTIDPRVRKVEVAQVGDAVSRVAIASTTGVLAEFARTDTWCMVYALAEDGDETETGFSYRIGRDLSELHWEQVAGEAVERSARMLGATKPETARVPVILDPFAGSSFLGVLASALSAEAVQKRRSLFADLVNERVGSGVVTLIDDGRLLDGPGAAPFDDEGVPTRRTDLISGGTLQGFLHNTSTARRGETESTGNAQRAGYRSTPDVGTTCFYLQAGSASVEHLLERAEGGVLIQDVSGVHSGANPISGEFSVGATGLRVRDGALQEGLREMTIASTIPEMLRGVAAVGSDLRFFSSVGVPSILIGEMTVAGV